MLKLVRRLGLIGAWLVTTAMAVGLANTSIQLVGGSVTDSPSLRVTALADDQPVTTVTTSSPVSVVVAGEESVPPGTAPNPSPTEGSTPNPPAAATPDSSTSTTTTSTTTTTVAETTSTTQVTGPFAFPTRGGTVTVRCRNGDAVLAGAVPRGGYAVELEPDMSGTVRVIFQDGDRDIVTVEVVCESGVATRITPTG